MAELIPSIDLSLTYWKTFETELSYQEILDKVEHAKGLLKGVNPSSLVLLQGFDPLNTWILILAAWQEDLSVLPLGKGVEKPNLPWALSLTAKEGSVERETREEFYQHDCRLYILSSGSTGQPKAIGHTIEGLKRSARATLDFYAFQSRDSWLLSLDPSHIGGFQILLRMWIGGGVLLYGGEPKFVAEALLNLKPTFLSLVPTQLFLLLDQDETKSRLQQCKAIMLGGAGVQPTLLERIKTLDLPISITYGSSETASQITGFPPGEFPRESQNVGQPLSHWTLTGEEGDLTLEGPSLYQGQFLRGAWEPRPEPFLLPDKGCLKDGYLFIEGRRDQIFQVAGVNVAPQEILGCLESAFNLGDLLLIPKSDAKFGHVPVLVIRSSNEPDLQAVLEAFSPLKPIKKPREIWWLRSAEVTKISRAQIELLWNSEHTSLKRLWTYEKI